MRQYLADRDIRPAVRQPRQVLADPVIQADLSSAVARSRMAEVNGLLSDAIFVDGVGVAGVRVLDWLIRIPRSLR